MAPELSLLYTDGAQIGYGRLGVYLAQHLAERGYKVYNDDGHPNASALTSQERREGKRVFGNPPPNLTCAVTIPAHLTGYFSGQHRSLVTMWETMTLPEMFCDNFGDIDTLIVPSTQNQELFSRYHDNVQLMLLGVDANLWHYIPAPPVINEFRFLIAGSGTRKGVDLAFRAFQEVFAGMTSGPQPKLLMKSRRGQEYFDKNVEHVTGHLDPTPERDLYASAHCYLQPSRGEGFGLQPLQAMALGRPTILTNAHGHASFAELGVPLAWDAVPSDDWHKGDWWEPRYDDLCEAMWDVYKNYEAHTARALQAACSIAQSFTWDNTTDRFIDILGPEMTKPYAGLGAWIDYSHQLHPLVLTRDYHGNIAGRTLFFERGLEYWESADVKRIMFDAGILDPVCINEQGDGLVESQVAQLGKYRADMEYCPTCGTRVNTGVSRADDIERDMIAQEA